jgi:hypothetical protein
MDNLGVAIKPLKDVAVVIETLERLGIGVQRTKTIYPSAYLMKYKGVFKVMHFKEMLALDGNEAIPSEDDLQRRNSIIKLLENWGLLEVIDDSFPYDEDTVFVFVLPYLDKEDWKVVHKYRRHFKIIE